MVPSLSPSSIPSRAPSYLPSMGPSVLPSDNPSTLPSYSPSLIPSLQPSFLPSSNPTTKPSLLPSSMPTHMPTSIPSGESSMVPSLSPSSIPSRVPSHVPSNIPSLFPSDLPSQIPSYKPTNYPIGNFQISEFSLELFHVNLMLSGTFFNLNLNPSDISFLSNSVKSFLNDEFELLFGFNNNGDRYINITDFIFLDSGSIRLLSHTIIDRSNKNITSYSYGYSMNIFLRDASIDIKAAVGEVMAKSSSTLISVLQVQHPFHNTSDIALNDLTPIKSYAFPSSQPTTMPTESHQPTSQPSPLELVLPALGAAVSLVSINMYLCEHRALRSLLLLI